MKLNHGRLEEVPIGDQCNKGARGFSNLKTINILLGHPFQEIMSLSLTLISMKTFLPFLGL